MRAFCLDPDDASTARQAGQGAPAGRRARSRQLLAAIDSTYARTDEERRGIVRSMQLMSDEATTLTRELRESTASQLQAVLDHVKDVILTVDEAGHIVSVNATGQRVFGHAEAEVVGRPLSFLLPQLADKQSLAARARAARGAPRRHAGRSRFPRDARPACQRHVVLCRARRQQDAAESPHGVRRLFARYDRSQGRRSGAARQRGALSHAGRACAGNHHRRRSRPESARRRQRKRRALFQDGSRGAARRAVPTC